jgi:invasion protein IalB
MGTFGASAMKSRTVFSAATLALVLAYWAPTAAQAAQPTPPAKPAPAAPAAPAAGADTGGDAGGAPAAAAPAGGQAAWVKLCNTDPATKKELCLVIQELRAETGQFIASATLRQITGDTKISFIAAVPPGMLIQPGLRAQVDQGKQYPVKYGICYPNACYGEMEVDADFIASMKTGKQIILTTLNQQAKGVSFPMTLAGFTKAFEGKGLDASAQQARADDLNKALQARAEQARQKLIEQQKKEAGAPAPAQQ